MVSDVTACACERALVCEASRKTLVRPHDTADRRVAFLRYVRIA